MKPINVAIAGSGYSAKVFHIPFLKQDSRFSVKKVYERNSERAKNWLPDVEITRSYSQLLTDDIDLIIITTPNQTHYEMAKKAILAGKHLLVEKPLVATSSQAKELAELAEKNGVVLYVYQNRRWDSAVVTAQQILEQGLLGDVVDCEIRIDRYTKTKNVKQWKETGELGTGLVFDLGVHLIDQAVSLFGKPDAIFADIRYQHDDALSDDNFDLHLYYPNGLKVALLASKYVRETSPHFALHGKSGSYVKQNVDQQENLLNQGVAPIGHWNEERSDLWGILHTEIAGEVVRKPYPTATASYQNLYDDLYNAITHHQAPIVQLSQVILVLEIIEKAFESAKSGCKVTI